MNDDALLIKDRVQNTIQLGESHFREFKSALEGVAAAKRPRPASKIAADVAEALVAFANADGGELLIGVEDNRSITGVPHGPDDLATIMAAPKTHVHPDAILPMTAATSLLIDGHTVLLFSVAKSTTEIFQLTDGRCVRRRDKATVPATLKQIHFERSEIRSREYDQQFVDGAAVGDLDLALAQAAADDFLNGLSIERYLQQIGLAEYGLSGIRLRRAALLLFARDIQKWHPRSQVRILKVNGTELKTGENYNVRSDEQVVGNLFELVRKSWEALRPFLAYKTEFGSDARFEQKYTYPEWACREAVINAIAHRDYTVHNGIDVFIFDDRIEIRNPGALLSTITLAELEELSGVHESRNALVAKVLKENKLMRELGEGMRRMFELMTENELERPKLHSESNAFGITLSHRSVFTSQQEQWVLMFQQFGLTTIQKRILILGMGEREISSAEIYRAMNTDDRNIYDREVTALRNSGLLIEIRTNPQATRLVRSNKIPKNQVPRFKVQVPGVSAPVVPRSTRPVAHKAIPKPQQFDVFVSNLPFDVSEQDLAEFFSAAGSVTKVYAPIDHATGKPRGFAFVSFGAPEAAVVAITTFNGSWFLGAHLTVKEASPRERRPLWRR